MAEDPLKTRDAPPAAGAAKEGIRLSKEQRKELLAEIDRQLSRAESPQRILQRAEQALADGNLDQARRGLQHLEAVAPESAGLAELRDRIERTAKEEKRAANLRQAEEMLRRYIQQRKKPLAELALATLAELAPNHPRRHDYERWVADLEREVALQQQIDRELAAGRTALTAGDLGRARRHLGLLRKLEPSASAVEELAGELTAAEQERAESADIERLKRRFEQLLRGGRFEEAARDIERLAALDVPKVTIDFLRRHLEEARRLARDRADAELLLALFERHVEARDWQSAREAAHRYGERFPDLPDAARLFNQVTELEAAERRRHSLEQGLATLERFLAEGRRREAETALTLLERLDLDEQRLADLRKRVAELGEGEGGP